jgi:photosystem II stability/assembly factor-like uncharacterized protein
MPVLLLMGLVAAPALAGGRRWQALGGPEAGSVQALVPSPSRSGALWAAAAPGGVFRKDDAGAEWSELGWELVAHPTTPIPFGPWPPRVVSALAVDPLDPRTAYAAAESSLLRTRDGGATWDSLGFPSIAVIVYGVLADPFDSHTLWAGTSSGLFLSRDRGTTWQQVPTPAPAGHALESLALDPTTPGTILAGLHSLDDLDQGELLRSTDSGATWTVSLRDVAVRALVFDPATPGSVYAGGDRFGVLLSRDGGATWKPAVHGLTATAPSALAVDAESGTLYLGVIGLRKEGQLTFNYSLGVFRSDNGGQSWVAAHRGLGSAPLPPMVHRLVADPETAEVLYAATDEGVWKTVTGGRTWRKTKLPLATANDLALDPRSPRTLYAVGAGADGTFAAAKSTDGGATGSLLQVAPGTSASPPLALAVDPTFPARVYIGAAAGLFRSDDGGAGWHLININRSYSQIVVDPAQPATLIAPTFSEGFIRSRDSGGSWERVPYDPRTASTRWLAVDPRLGTLFAATDEGVFASRDHGDRWQRIGVGLEETQVWLVAVDPAAKPVLYASPALGGHLLSLDLP